MFFGSKCAKVDFVCMRFRSQTPNYSISLAVAGFYRAHFSR